MGRSTRQRRFPSHGVLTQPGSIGDINRASRNPPYQLTASAKGGKTEVAALRRDVCFVPIVAKVFLGVANENSYSH
jgi:hypothetical protein